MIQLEIQVQQPAEQKTTVDLLLLLMPVLLLQPMRMILLMQFRMKNVPVFALTRLLRRRRQQQQQPCGEENDPPLLPVIVQLLCRVSALVHHP